MFASFLTLFVIQTGEGWPDLMWNSIHATNKDEGPIKYYRMGVAAYYIIFNVIFPFFFVNIFVALVIITFQEGDENQDDSLLEKNDKACIDYAINCKPVNRHMPANKTGIQFKFWKIAASTQFEWIILVIIVLNTVVLMLKDYTLLNTSPEYVNFLYLCNVVFTVLFTFEFIVKIMAYGIGNYFSDAWNIFDFIIVLGSIADVSITTMQKVTQMDDMGGVTNILSFLVLFV